MTRPQDWRFRPMLDGMDERIVPNVTLDEPTPPPGQLPESSNSLNRGEWSYMQGSGDGAVHLTRGQDDGLWLVVGSGTTATFEYIPDYDELDELFFAAPPLPAGTPPNLPPPVMPQLPLPLPDPNQEWDKPPVVPARPPIVEITPVPPPVVTVTPQPGDGPDISPVNPNRGTRFDPATGAFISYFTFRGTRYTVTMYPPDTNGVQRVDYQIGPAKQTVFYPPEPVKTNPPAPANPQ